MSPPHIATVWCLSLCRLVAIAAGINPQLIVDLETRANQIFVVWLKAKINKALYIYNFLSVWLF